jgi:hypothetical protein
VGITDEPGKGGRANDFATLALAAGGVAAAAAGFVPLRRLYLERDEDYSSVVPHPGGLVDLTEAALALLLGLGMLLAAVVVSRGWRRTRDQAPRRLLPVVGAVVPGLALGLALQIPFEHAVLLASDHTAAAKATARWERQRLEQYQLSPAVSVPASPAPPGLAALLLRPRDLGPGWYDGLRPNPATRSPVLGEKPVVSARSTLVRTHREGVGWALANPLLTEGVTVLGTPAAAAAEVLARTAAPPGSHNVTRHVLGVEVTQLVTPRAAQTEVAGFVVGRYAFVLRCTGMPGNDVSTLVDAAVKRALAGSR